MSFRTELHLPTAPFIISHSDEVFLIGSCFAENIGAKLQHYRFPATINSHGILFNPVSIVRAMNDLMSERTYHESELIKYNERYISLHHHGKFSSTDKETALTMMNESIIRCSAALKKARLLIITFGSAWAWRHLDTDCIVANCHKLPQSAFVKELIPHEHIVQNCLSLIERLKSFNPTLTIAFTVSPVRYLRDGLVQNNISKSHLLIAAHKLCEANDHCFYFPAYEWVIDDLRDYRFYKEDMLHPGPIAIDYLWQKFGAWCFSEKTLAKLKQLDKHLGIIHHQPIHADPAHERAVADAKEAIEMLISRQ